MLRFRPLLLSLLAPAAVTSLLFIPGVFAQSASKQSAFEHKVFAPGGQAHYLIGGKDSEGPSWMAALLHADYQDAYHGQFCGATLIAPQWALTAAHCVHPYNFGFSSPAEVDLLAATPELRDGQGERVEIVEWIIHPGFVVPGGNTGIEYDNDLALLRLARPVDLQAVDLPAPEFDVMHLPAGTPTQLMGWGARVYDENSGAQDYPRRLQTVTLPLVNGMDCLRVMGAGEVSSNMLCAGDPLMSGDSCVGDSGGPLAVRADTPSGWRQIGIISWGLGCGLPGSYGIYTRLARYTLWISNRICEAADRPPAPRIEALETGNGRITLRLSSARPGVRHRIYYRSAIWRSPVRHIEIGSASEYSTSAPAGVPLEVAVQSYDGPCQSAFSEIRSFTLQDRP